ncbi:MAG: hypothetical protein K2Q20_02640, partial [Phycisphaerales bacterium]|nr:hypothetical protein [Phycisphaerales bacterium]
MHHGHRPTPRLVWLVVALVAAGAGSALAQCGTTGNSRCDDGEVCLWKDDGSRSCFYDATGRSPFWANGNFPGSRWNGNGCGNEPLDNR